MRGLMIALCVFWPTLRVDAAAYGVHVLLLDLLLRVQMIVNPCNSHLIDTRNQNQSYSIIIIYSILLKRRCTCYVHTEV